MALWIIFIPLIIFVNSFLVGKLYKRFYKQLNSYITTLLGFFGFFGLLSLSFTVIVLFNINLYSIFYILLAYQIILAILYIVNWRWLFITYNINWKKLFLFFSIIIFCILAYVITRNYSSDNINWYLSSSDSFYNYYLNNYHNKEVSEIIIFQFGSNYLNTNFLYIFLSAFAYLFNIDLVHIKLFYTLINCIFLFFILSFIATHLYSVSKESNWYKNILITVSVSFILALLCFWLDKYIWIITFTTLLVIIQTSKQNEINSQASISAINFIVLTGVYFDIQFLLVALAINLIQLFVSYKAKKENATDYNVLMLFSTLLYTCMIFENTNYLSFILIITIIVIYTFYIFYKSSNIAFKVNQRIDNFMYAKINWISLVFICLILLLSIIFFISNKNFEIYTNPWLLSIYTDNVNGQTISLVVNIFFWTINVFILINVLFNNSIVRFKKLSYGYIPEADLSMMLIIAFWNPISLNLFSLIYSIDLIYIQPNFQVLFFAVLCPLLISIFRKVRTKKQNLSYYIYGSSFLISTIIIITSINLGAF